MNKRIIGAQYEQTACDYLKTKGYRIAERNYRCKAGEIDIIAWDGKILVFIEVKYRKNLKMGSPLEAVDKRKQTTIRRVAAYYLYEKRLSFEMPVRFDVVGILGEKIELIKDAF